MIWSGMYLSIHLYSAPTTDWKKERQRASILSPIRTCTGMVDAIPWHAWSNIRGRLTRWAPYLYWNAAANKLKLEKDRLGMGICYDIISLANNGVEEQHVLLRELFQDRLYLAPIQSPRSVLDIRTGTGCWAMECGMFKLYLRLFFIRGLIYYAAERYPSSTVSLKTLCIDAKELTS